MHAILKIVLYTSRHCEIFGRVVARCQLQIGGLVSLQHPTQFCYYYLRASPQRARAFHNIVLSDEY
jgi:hypothetical protein